MDPQITAAIIIGLATMVAPVIGWWLYRKFFNTHSNTQPSSIPPSPDDSNSPNPLTQRNHLRPSAITVKEIIEAINSAPSYQKQQIADHYKGINVKLTGYLNTTLDDPHNRNNVRVNLNIDPDVIIGDSIWFSEKVTNFPEIRSLKKGSKVSVAGKILSASGDGLCVELEPNSIEVLQSR